MSWHADIAQLRSYAIGDIDDPSAFSLEAHLMSCAPCRAALAEFADRERLEFLWRGVSALLHVPRPGFIERFMLRAGLTEHDARLLAATPSLRASWLLAVATALAFAVVAGRHAPSGLTLFLVVAPLLPLAGVGVAFGPGIDPTYEVGLASPIRSFRLLLVRAAAVLTTSAALAGVAALLLPDLGWTVLAWLLPSIGLVTISLGLSTLTPPLWSTIGVGLAWVGTVTFLATNVHNDLSLFGAEMQLTFLLAILFSAAVLVMRRECFERGDHR